jgi:hypothetical protein
VAENSPPTPDLTDTFDADARVTLFGFDPTPARVRLQPHSRAWRLRGVIPIVGLTILGLPLGAIPPHAPWVLAVVGTGTFMARRRWKWHYTILRLEGICPRCEAELSIRPGRLKRPHTVTCDACGHDTHLEIAPEALAEHAAATE